MSNSNDFPLVEAPAAGRKGVFSIAMVLFSFTFFTGTMFAGGKLGVSFSIVNLLWIAVIGNALLALYAASLGWIAARSGLNTVLMGRFCFGEIGSKLADFILGFAELAGAGHRHGRYLVGEDPRSAEALTQPLMVLFGILFCVTALVGWAGRAVAPVGAIDVCAADGLHVSGAAPRRRLAGDDPYCAERHHDRRRPSPWSSALSPAAPPVTTGPGWLTPAGPPFSPAWAASSSATG
ncbi:Cytosine permease [Klebsiella pneumoniae]|nr:Cytosine permease [Klebsiella pneumoniae]